MNLTWTLQVNRFRLMLKMLDRFWVSYYTVI